MNIIYCIYGINWNLQPIDKEGEDLQKEFEAKQKAKPLFVSKKKRIPFKERLKQYTLSSAQLNKEDSLNPIDSKDETIFSSIKLNTEEAIPTVKKTQEIIIPISKQKVLKRINSKDIKEKELSDDLSDKTKDVQIKKMAGYHYVYSIDCLIGNKSLKEISYANDQQDDKKGSIVFEYNKEMNEYNINNDKSTYSWSVGAIKHFRKIGTITNIIYFINKEDL